MSKRTKHKASNSSSDPATVNRKIILTAQFCLIIAASIAGYLLWYSVTQKPMAGCGPGSSCDRVMGSSWAYWFSIPVSAPALLAYLTLLCGIEIVRGRQTSPDLTARGWKIILFAGTAVLASAIWFTSIQICVLNSLCKFCTSAHLLGSLGVLLLLSQIPRVRSANPTLKTTFSFRRLSLPIAAGLVAFGVLAGVQKSAPHRTNILAIYNGSFKFNLRQVPLIGSPDSTHYIISFFDYTCPECQSMHHDLLAARERLTNSFSIVSLPMPLDPRCNPVVKVAMPKHVQACDYARIGLALRLAGPEPFRKYDEWYFSQPHTPPLDEARAQAASLIGADKLDKNMIDPWVDQMIQTSVSIYSRNRQIANTGRIPQLIIGNKLNVGRVRNVDELVALIQQNLP
jgi:uncharacterized membrane protein